MDPAENVELDPLQQEVVNKVMKGKSVFFTGSAGTGKTMLLNTILLRLKSKFGAAFEERVAVTAMTGIAATHIDGTTLNSALGIGVPRAYRDFRAMHRKDASARIRKWQVLLVDEVSMMSAELFEIVEHMLREVRRSSWPAGGLQLIFCGDFFQLPPVCKFSFVPGAKGCELQCDVFTNFGYAFQAPSWPLCFAQDDHVTLSRVFRQTEATFTSTLNKIRTGESAKEALGALVKECSRPVTCAEGIKPTRLFARNADVDKINGAELAALPGEEVVSGAKDDVVVHAEATFVEDAEQRLKRNEFFRDCAAGPTISLKAGAQVMLVKNIDLLGGLVNGSRGVVVGFVRKSVAFAIARDAMSPTQQSEASFAVARWPGDLVPMVRFVNGRELAILPVVYRHDVAGIGECRRVQLPLKLAWTMTIHKSQGLTLDAVQVSLSGMFAPGQAYVALSRARNKAGLEIVDWDNRVVGVDPAVKAFYNDPRPSIMRAWPDFSTHRWGTPDYRGCDMLAAGHAHVQLNSNSGGAWRTEAGHGRA